MKKIGTAFYEKSNQLDQETYRLVKEAMASTKSKEEFRLFIERKKQLLNSRA